jgi:nitrate/TMAO reductase-like tetraheme cytochrome c subunit
MNVTTKFLFGDRENDPSAMGDRHANLRCTECHGGDRSKLDKKAAHVGLIADPSKGAVNACSKCHGNITRQHKDSIHFKQTGYFTAYEQRAGRKADAAFQKLFDDHCLECHTSCGQCHVSKPHTVRSGLIWGHVFKKKPNPFLQCTACHGSRIGQEFKGDHKGLSGDVHFTKNSMNCVDCHTAAEMHGSKGSHRYEVDKRVKCEDCHKNVGSDDDTVAMHKTHKGKLSCYVCHSQPYKNCYQCHVGKGIQKPSELDFRIGKNPRKSAARPYDYVLLRHIPIAPNTYSVLDPSLILPNYDKYPTWMLTSPHNIIRKAPQTESCNACHGNKDVFLTQEYIESMVQKGLMVQQELEANKAVVADPPAAR